MLTASGAGRSLSPTSSTISLLVILSTTLPPITPRRYAAMARTESLGYGMEPRDRTTKLTYLCFCIAYLLFFSLVLLSFCSERMISRFNLERVCVPRPTFFFCFPTRCLDYENRRAAAAVPADRLSKLHPQRGITQKCMAIGETRARRHSSLIATRRAWSRRTRPSTSSSWLTPISTQDISSRQTNISSRYVVPLVSMGSRMRGSSWIP